MVSENSIVQSMKIEGIKSQTISPFHDDVRCRIDSANISWNRALLLPTVRC